MNPRTKLERYEENVLSKFKLYDSIFSTLPYSKITNTATLEPNHSLSLMDAYDAVRNFPSIDGTSRLGIHLRFGTLSIKGFSLLDGSVKHARAYGLELLFKKTQGKITGMAGYTWSRAEQKTP